MDACRYVIHDYDTLDSTNEEAKRLLSSGAIKIAPLGKPVAVIAEEQTAGKGTHGRQWVSPKGAGLYISIVHTSVPELSEPLSLSPYYTQAAGLACLETLRHLFGLSIQLKPVNDLYVRCPQTGEYRKLGGILVESVLHDNALKNLVTGIGINVRAVERNLGIRNSRHPEIIPISLEELLDTPKWRQIVDVSGEKNTAQWAELIETLIQEADTRYQQVSSGETDALTHQYQLACIRQVTGN